MRVVIFFVLTLTVTVSLAFANEKLPILKAGNETYSNITVISVSAADICFTCDKGLICVNLKDLDPAMQRHFNYHAPATVPSERATPTATLSFSKSNHLVEMTPSPELDRVEENDKQVAVLYREGQSARALTLALRDLKLSESDLGPEHPMTTICLNDLGWMYQNVGDLTNAEKVFKRCLEIRERVLGPAHPWTALSLYNLADCYMKLGKNSLAEPLYERGLAIDEKRTGLESMTTARDLARIAENESRIGNFEKAKEALERNLAIMEKLEGPESPGAGSAMLTLGIVYRQMGNFAQSESYYRHALAIEEKNPSSDNSYIPLTLSGLGELYMDMGDYPRAETFIRRAIKINEEAFGPESSKTAFTLRDLVLLYSQEGKYVRANSLAHRVFTIIKKADGTNSLQTADALNNLGAINIRMGNYAKAESYTKQGLAIRERILGPENPLVASSLGGLAIAREEMGDSKGAAPLLRRALNIEEQAFGPDNPAAADTLEGLAEVYFDLQQTNRSLAYAAKLEQARLMMLANILSFTSERQRLQYEAQFDPYSMFASLNDAQQMALTVLRHKGIVLDSLLEDQAVERASRDPEVHALIEQLKPAKQRLTRMLMAAPKNLNPATLKNWAEARDKLSNRVQKLEGALAQKVAGFGHARRALAVTVAQVQKVIPPKAVLLEYVRYQRYLGHQRWENNYGAVILASHGKPKWVCLGAARATDKNVLLCQEAVRDRKGNDEAKLSTALHNLYDQIWKPLEPLLPADTKIVIISPDASLNFISFATLLTPHNRFLAEKYSVRYVASGRDLLRRPAKSSSQEMVIFAAPDFDADGAGSGDKTGLYLQPLPYFARNAAQLEAEVKTWGWPVRVYSGVEATETRVRLVDAPRILHFATHGFFLPETIQGLSERFSFFGYSLGWTHPQPRVVLVNPMDRSGIALAGAQTTLDAWQQGRIPPTATDGILTAEEVGSLNLHGTWLVVLSACDTGIGAPMAGEGVMGLRRGFVEAGAQNLLMTLWPVFDVPSGQLMLDFYSKLHQDNNPPEALAVVQRDALVKLRAKYGLLPAVVMAGGFIVSSQGPIR